VVIAMRIAYSKRQRALQGLTIEKKIRKSLKSEIFAQEMSLVIVRE